MMAKTEKEKPNVNKEFIKEHMDGKEIDLSMCSLSKVPVKELVSCSRVTRFSKEYSTG